MTDTRKVLEAASALSHALRERGVGHAFHGGIIPAVLSQSPLTYDVVCIVEGGQFHPFRRVRDALAGNTMFTVIQSTWTNRLHVRYLLCTPMIELEILPAGEFGPRILNSTTCMRISGLPYLSISEFVRAKLKCWMMYAGSCYFPLSLTYQGSLVRCAAWD